MHATGKKKKIATLRLEGDLTIERAAELLDLLRNTLESSDKVKVEFGEVGAADFTCLQLLCSTHRTAVKRGKQFTFGGGRPDFLCELARQAGFIRKEKCGMNPDNQDCLWLGGLCNE